MPIFRIDPMVTTTTGGFTAEITGINSGSTDFIVGTVDTPTGKHDVMWNDIGICRDNPPELNLDTHSNEFIEACDAGRNLRGE